MNRSGFANSLVGLVLVLVGSLGISACAATAPAPAKPAVTTAPAAASTATTAPSAKEAKPVASTTATKVGVTANTSDAGLFIATAKGYFKEEQMEVELEVFDSAVRMIPALATGQIVVGGGSIGAGLFNAIKRDIPLKIVADKGSGREKAGASSMVVRKDLIDGGVIKDFKDLKGKTYAVSAAGNTHHIDVAKALERGGLTLADAKVVEMSFPDMNAAYANKSIDFSMQIEPLTGAGEQKGLFVRWKSEYELYPNHQAGALLYSPKFTADNPEIAKRFMVAYLRGVRDYVDAFSKGKGKAEVVPILAKYLAVQDPSVFDRTQPAGMNPDGYVDADSVNYDQNWLAKNDFLKELVDLKTVIDNQYVDYAVQKLGKYD